MGSLIAWMDVYFKLKTPCMQITKPSDTTLLIILAF